MYSYSFDNLFKKTGSGGVTPPYTFLDADAQAYYNALSTANGGDIDANTLYSISLNTLKQAIDNWFINTKLDSTYTNVLAIWLNIGGTAATHAVEAISTTSLATYTDCTHSSSGIALNGTSSFIDSNVVPDTLGCGNNDNHIMMFHRNVINSISCGSTESGTEVLGMSGTALDFDGFSTTSAATRNVSNYVGLDIDVPIIYTRNASNDVQLYEDGVSVASAAGTNVGSSTPNLLSTYFGANNNLGVDASHSESDFIAGGLGLGLSSGQCSTLSTELNTLNTTLGR